MSIEPMVSTIDTPMPAEKGADIIYEASAQSSVPVEEATAPKQEPVPHGADATPAPANIERREEAQETAFELCANEAQCAVQYTQPLRVGEDELRAKPQVKEDKGIMFFKKWWFRREVDFSVNGEMITGTPIVLSADTLRVVDEQYSYFIPIKNVDYIRTKDGYGRF